MIRDIETLNWIYSFILKIKSVSYYKNNKIYFELGGGWSKHYNIEKRGAAKFYYELITELIKEDKNENRESAIVPEDKYYFSPEINIYDNKVMIASWREQLGIIIESEEISDAMKKAFELAWAEAKRQDVELRKNS